MLSLNRWLDSLDSLWDKAKEEWDRLKVLKSAVWAMALRHPELQQDVLDVFSELRDAASRSFSLSTLGTLVTGVEKVVNDGIIAYNGEADALKNILVGLRALVKA